MQVYIFPGQGAQFPGMGKDFMMLLQSLKNVLNKLMRF